MAIEFHILHLQFGLPESFSHETEVVHFEEKPYPLESDGRSLQIVTGKDQTGGMLTSHFQEWLKRAYSNVELTEDRDQDNHRVLGARAKSPSGDPVRAAVATIPDQDGLRLRFLSVGDGLGGVWRSTLKSIRQEEEGRHGWLKEGSRRYQVKEVSLKVPEGWQDTTDYLLSVGSPSDSTLEVNINWAAERDFIPRKRVKSFLKRFQSIDDSVKVLEDRPVKIDECPGYYCSFTCTESDSSGSYRVRFDYIAVETIEEHGVLLLASGPQQVFSEYNNDWEKLISGLVIQ